MESKTCNTCGKTKPISQFYKLRKDREWRRSKCIDCHIAADRLNRKIRLSSASIVLFLISFLSLGQSLEQKRLNIIDSLNYYRAAPVERMLTHYGVVVNPKEYKPKAKWIVNEELTRRAQKHANYIARTGKYRHSNLKGCRGESMDAINTEWQGDYLQSIQRFLVDYDDYYLGHRRHLLVKPEDEIGVGIAYADDGYVYIVIQTKGEYIPLSF